MHKLLFIPLLVFFMGAEVYLFMTEKEPRFTVPVSQADLPCIGAEFSFSEPGHKRFLPDLPVGVANIPGRARLETPPPLPAE